MKNEDALQKANWILEQSISAVIEATKRKPEPLNDEAFAILVSKHMEVLTELLKSKQASMQRRKGVFSSVPRQDVSRNKPEGW